MFYSSPVWNACYNHQQLVIDSYSFQEQCHFHGHPMTHNYDSESCDYQIQITVSKLYHCFAINSDIRFHLIYYSYSINKIVFMINKLIS